MDNPDPDGVNPNMPSFIAQAPWYIKGESGSLNHQKSQKSKPKSTIDTWYTKGTTNSISKKFQKGACTNCGAPSHNAKDCVERPRKVGAKYSNRDFKPEENVQKIDLDYDGKRDRWNGYQPDMYKKVIEEYEQIETEKKKRKIESNPEPTEDPESVEINDEAKNQTYAYSEMVNNVDPRTKTITSNNRVRDDTACYLWNLDHTNANYDGKSRSMNELEVGKGNDSEEDQMYRDSWMKISGDMVPMIEQEEYVQKLYERGHDLHPLANPSQSELVYKWFKEESKKRVTKKKKKLLDMYGDQDEYSEEEALSKDSKTQKENSANESVESKPKDSDN